MVACLEHPSSIAASITQWYKQSDRSLRNHLGPVFPGQSPLSVARCGTWLVSVSRLTSGQIASIVGVNVEKVVGLAPPVTAGIGDSVSKIGL